MNEITPLVSVIIPVYNSELYLERCLHSIISQSFQHIEIIAINDGSIDKSQEILLDYAKKDSRIQIITQPNHGTGYSRNKGIYHSSSEFILFVDSDDSIELNTIELLYNEIAFSDADLVFMRCKYISNQNHIDKFSPILSDTNKWNIFSSILANNFTPSACLFIARKNLYIQNKILFPEANFYEDPYTTYKLVYFSRKISYIDQALYNYYYQNVSSVTNALTPIHIRNIIDMMASPYTFLHQNNLFIKYKIAYFKRLYNISKWFLDKIEKLANHEHKINLIINFWETASQLDLYEGLHLSKKIHLIFLSFKILGDDKTILLKTVLEKSPLNNINFAQIDNLIRSPYGLLQNIIDYINLNKEIDEVFVYGTGTSFNKIYPALKTLNIKIQNLIDNHCSDSLPISCISLEMFFEKILNIKNKNIYVVIASESSVEEIKKNIQLKNIHEYKIHLIDFTK